MHHAFRRLLASPGFTSSHSLTLALGIGVNTSMFSVLRALLLRTLPYPDSDRLVRIYRTSPQSQAWPHSAANFLAHQSGNQSFEKMAAMSWTSSNLTEPGRPAERLRAMDVTADFFSTLGLPPVLGPRLQRGGRSTGRKPGCCAEPPFLAPPVRRRSDHRGTRPAAERRAGHDRRRDAASLRGPHALGHASTFGGRCAFSDQQRQDRVNNYLNAIARLKPGVSLAQAQAETSARRRAARQRLSAAQRAQRPPARAARALRRMTRRPRMTWFVAGARRLRPPYRVRQSRESPVRAHRRPRPRIRHPHRARRVTQRALSASCSRKACSFPLAGGALGLVLALWCNDLISRHFVITDERGLAISDRSARDRFRARRCTPHRRWFRIAARLARLPHRRQRRRSSKARAAPRRAVRTIACATHSLSWRSRWH